MNSIKLQFSKANAKISRLANIAIYQPYLNGNRKIYSLDLLSGWSCPAANICLSKVYINAERKSKIRDGKNTQFRCYSASQEAFFTKTYLMRKRNFEILSNCKSIQSMTGLILDSIPKNSGIIRIHTAGDFFNRNYFRAWCDVARLNKDILFYAYTKALNYWVDNLANIPDNLILTASYGGKYDKLIKEYNLRSVKVVYSKEEAKRKGLIIDNSDNMAANPNRKHIDFALLIHGIQPAKSKASISVVALDGEGSYGRNKIK